MGISLTVTTNNSGASVAWLYSCKGLFIFLIGEQQVLHVGKKKKRKKNI